MAMMPEQAAMCWQRLGVRQSLRLASSDGRKVQNFGTYKKWRAELRYAMKLSREL
jgi:hypothetical protein